MAQWEGCDHPAELDPLSTSVSGCCGLSGKSDHTAELDPLSTSVSWGAVGSVGNLTTQLSWILSPPVCHGALWAQWEGCDYTAVLDPLSTSVSRGVVGSVEIKAVITQLSWILSPPLCLGVLLRLLDQHHMCHTS